MLTLGEWEPLFPPDGVAPTPQAPASPQEMQEGPVPAPLAWSDALEACTRLPVQSKQHAYEMSYGYLDGGPAWLSGLGSELREDVSRLNADDELPEPLAKTLFAWKNATFILKYRGTGDS